MKSKAFLEEIRRTEGLCRAVLKKIEIDGRTVIFHLVTDVTYSQEDVAFAGEVAAKYVPAGYTAQVQVLKSVPSEEGVRREIAEFLRTRYPAVAAFVTPQDIEIVRDTHGGRFYISAGDEALLDTAGTLDELHKALQRTFCGNWYGEFRHAVREKGEIEREAPPPPEHILSPRYFAVEEYVAIDGGAPERAIYIADLNKEMTAVTVCGKVTYIEERETKNGKPYFSMTISDGTGNLRCAYFTRKATLEKVRSIKQDDSICITGDNEIFNGSLSFRAKLLDYGSAPVGFVPEARPSRPVPPQYRVVFPSPEADLVQGGIFDEVRIPQVLFGRKYVVFDLETTGLNSTPSAGMDRIIEIGAVKIEDGRISEKFSTFVACPVRLSDEIIKLTGITDDMLVGAPKIEEVVADFFRFCDGCELVAHNASFDCKFIHYYGEQEGYLFDHRQHDTVAFSQEILHLSNYKLNTVADHFGFTFNHHRAYDDAFVTAKIFLELVKLKDGLPR